MSREQSLEGGADRSVEELRQKLSEMQDDLEYRRETAERAVGERDLIRQYIDLAGVLFVVIGADETVRMVNRKTSEVLGVAEEEIVGCNWFDTFLPARIRPEVHAIFTQLMSGALEPVEFADGVVVTREGKERTIAWHNSILRDGDGNPVGALSAGEDVTDRHQMEQKIARDVETIRRQAEDILQMSTPVLQIWEGVLVAPLVGTLDSERTQQFVEHLLEQVVNSKSPTVLLDITGVPSVDTQTAQHIIDTISAVRLLGAQVILTGVRPAIAQTLVHLGIDLSDVATKNCVAAGLRMVFESAGVVAAHE
ncbi:MAG: PAS domain S-box protein [Dehalococcoidia bacterium]|nr:PAS domain S-box protein [Dehalococcoidia bacterium]